LVLQPYLGAFGSAPALFFETHVDLPLVRSSIQ